MTKRRKRRQQIYLGIGRNIFQNLDKSILYKDEEEHDDKKKGEGGDCRQIQILIKIKIKINIILTLGQIHFRIWTNLLQI